MLGHPHEGMPEGSVPTEISSSSSEGKRIIIPQAPSSSFDSLEALPSALADTCPPPLACPVSGCLLVLKGEMPHRYLKRHPKYPGLHGRMGDEREAWLNLHKMEHEKFLAALGSTPSHNTSPKEVPEVGQANYADKIKLVEDDKAEEERESRAAEFELRAKNMGITEMKFVAQKVAIWEGMWVAKQNGDDIGGLVVKYGYKKIRTATQWQPHYHYKFITPTTTTT
ncbi:hypothetical protein B9Z19DRAFT_1136520 [Tuber borchii]|uniref:Uncharacterized protein n=1 Tax=Tuber borchii TaxID=42251 RepID=A0A2T6ZBJ2_TUBBO|nr:hypothetical protein B9Z19DRAFT_1136520 [Tuber borchii]